jgi:hypothetical protein
MLLRKLRLGRVAEQRQFFFPRAPNADAATPKIEPSSQLCRDESNQPTSGRS